MPTDDLRDDSSGRNQSSSIAVRATLRCHKVMATVR